MDSNPQPLERPTPSRPCPTGTWRPAPQAHGALADAMQMGSAHNQPPAQPRPLPAPQPAAALLRRLSRRANVSQMAPEHTTNREGLVNIPAAGLINSTRNTDTTMNWRYAELQRPTTPTNSPPAQRSPTTAVAPRRTAAPPTRPERAAAALAIRAASPRQAPQAAAPAGLIPAPTTSAILGRGRPVAMVAADTAAAATGGANTSRLRRDGTSNDREATNRTDAAAPSRKRQRKGRANRARARGYNIA